MKFPRRAKLICRPPDAAPLAGVFYLLLFFLLLMSPGVAVNLPPHRLEAYLEHCALGRLGRFDEVAQFAVFLISGDNGFMTGETIVIDGGL